MKFLRILPETCARTWCLFSSSTRNIALGSGSITVAITSIASSLEFPESPFFFSSRIGLAIVSRVYLAGLAPGHCNSYHDGPVISFGRVRIHGPLAVTPTVCSKCAEGLPSPVSATPSPPIPPSGLPAFTLRTLRPMLPPRNWARRIPVIAVHFHPEIERDDVAFAQLPLGRRDPVNDFAVHRRAQHAGITAISLERRLAWPPGDFFLGKLLEVHRRDSRFYGTSQRAQNLVNDNTGAVHLFQLSPASKINRHRSLFQDC